MRAQLMIPCVVVLAAGCTDPKPSPSRSSASTKAAESGAAKAKAEAAETKVEAAETKPDPPSGVFTKLSRVGDTCRRSLCIGGPGEVGSHAHFDFNEVCRRSQGSVQRCEGEQCTSVWPTKEWRAGLDALVSSLDKDGNGRIEGAEGECEVSLGGWSVGAVVAATELPVAFAERTDPAHAGIENLVAIAPYLDPDGAAPEGPFEIAASIKTAFIYRTSEAPKTDCSREFAGGPWVSPKPVCGADTRCYDYDYASNGSEFAYIGRRGNRAGSEIGHCTMTSFVARFGLDNLVEGVEGYQKQVPPYADGERGGRVRDEGPPPKQPAAPG